MYIYIFYTLNEYKSLAVYNIYFLNIQPTICHKGLFFIGMIHYWVSKLRELCVLFGAGGRVGGTYRGGGTSFCSLVT